MNIAKANRKNIGTEIIVIPLLMIIFAVFGFALIRHFVKTEDPNPKAKAQRLGYVLDNKITKYITENDQCVKKELRDKACFSAVPKNQKADIIYDSKTGWMYGNWYDGSHDVWGWFKADNLKIQ